MSKHTHNVKNNDVRKVVKVKNNDVSKGVKVRFEETPEGYPIGRTESGNVSFQPPALLEERKKRKGTQLVFNPDLPPKRSKYPIDPNDFWTKSDIINAKEEFRQEAVAELKRQDRKKYYSNYSNSDDSNSDDSNSNDSNSNIFKCIISGGRSKKRRRRSQKRRRRNKKTHRHRKK
jgi:hypothetical protein